MILVTALHFAMVYRTNKVKYSKLFSPIMIFTPFLLGYWIIVKIGIIPTVFYPRYCM